MPPNTSKAQRQPASFLFLAGHGLLTPLSAIRWAASRLRGSQETFTEEQQGIVDQIDRNTALLSRMLHSMLQLTQMEEHINIPVQRTFSLRTMLQKECDEWEKLQGASITIHCDDDLMITSDSLVYEQIIENLLAIFLGEDGKQQEITLYCATEDEKIVLTIEGKMHVPLLQYVQTIQLDDNIRSIVGGTQGLFLAITQRMLEHIGGTLDMSEEENHKYIVTATFPLASETE